MALNENVIVNTTTTKQTDIDTYNRSFLKYVTKHITDSLDHGEHNIREEYMGKTGSFTDANTKRFNDLGEHILFQAVLTDSEQIVSTLIGDGVDTNITSNEGKTALFCAVLNNNESIVRMLIAAGADVNITDKNGNSALLHAVGNGNESVVRILIDAGADVNDTDNDGKSALVYAVINDSINMVRILIEDGNAHVNARDFYGRTPLFFALTKSLRSAQYLLDKGGNLHVRDNFGLSVLSFFFDECLNNSGLSFSSPHMFECLDFLTCHGVGKKAVFKAMVDILFCKSILLFTSGTDSEAFTEALKFAKQFVSKVFGSKRRVIKKMMIVVMRNKIDKIPDNMVQLVEFGANPNSADSDGNTALHYATRLPFYGVSEKTVMDILSKLDTLGVSFNIKNHKSETPLLFCLSKDVWEIARQYKQWSGIKILVNVCKFLLERGSSIDEIPRSEMSIFHLILELIQELLQMHYTLEMKESLTEAIELFQLFVQANVVRRGISVNRKDVHLSSPLHKWATLALMSTDMYIQTLVKDYTFQKLMKVILMQFLACGAILNDRNENEKTPLHLCKTWTAVTLLLDAGANPNDVDSLGCPPLLSAAKNKTFLGSPGSFFPDVSIEPKEFWKTVLDKGLDPWTVDKYGESVLSILIESEQFTLTKALVEVACEDNYTQSKITSVSLLNAICKDKSTHAHWKSILVDNILRSRKSPTSASSALRFCCKNIIQSRNNSIGSESQHKEAKLEILHDIKEPLLKKIKRNKLELTDDLKSKDSFINEIEASVHWNIAKHLLLYGADCRIPDDTGQSCLDIAETCPQLKDLLLKPVDIDEIPLLIPWTSVSKRYEQKLARVARRQECEQVDPFWYHKEHLGCGSFGHVFAGMNEKDGREVAIKRIEKLRMLRPEDKQEIKNLTVLADCEQVVRYFGFFEDKYFCYVVLELMEGNLCELLDNNIPIETRAQLCQDVVMGLNYLHSQCILHRDLKPNNILFKNYPELCLKIADFGLSHRIGSTGSTSVYGSNVGTRCWIAPEMLKSRKAHSKSSDVFSCGLVLHYTLSIKKHPFVPTDCTKKSELQINHETEANLISGKMEGWDDSLPPEATHLIKKMLENDRSKRPGTDKILSYPFYWSKKKKIKLLVAVGNQPEFECPRAKRSVPLTAVEIDLETKFTTIVKYANWNDLRYLHMPAIYLEMTRKRKPYDTHSIVELIRFIRNVIVHMYESIRPRIRKLLPEDVMFLEYFPNLVIEVFNAVTANGWDQTREEIKYVLK